MLLHRDGRLYTMNASFVLPNDIYIDTEPVTPYEYGISGWLRGKEATFSLYEEDEDQPGEVRDLMREFLYDDDEPYTPYEEISEVHTNGLSGCETLYHNSGDDYYELWLRLPNDRLLKFFAQWSIRYPQKLKDLPEVQKLIQSIRGETVVDLD